MSPLDGDFFDLLGRLRGLAGNQTKSRAWVFKQLDTLSQNQRESLERSFYTLHLRALMASKLDAKLSYDEQTVVSNFVICIDATLRAAHGKRTCERHASLFAGLNDNDVILTFNYDLVAERALRVQAGRSDKFDPGIYGFDNSLGYCGPRLLKLHGSSNWILNQQVFEVRTKKWSDLEKSPNYRAALGGKGTTFAIFLPFWEKRVEQAPWLSLWKKAMAALKNVDRLIIWGYSLPPTDIRTEQLFELSINKRAIDLCVIDPSESTRSRWRTRLPSARYWQYRSISDYLKEPPDW